MNGWMTIALAADMFNSVLHAGVQAPVARVVVPPIDRQVKAVFARYDFGCHARVMPIPLERHEDDDANRGSHGIARLTPDMGAVDKAEQPDQT